jgi:predicted TPR repeat methyltransferase
VANSNSVDALNLYARVEDLLGIKEYAPKLYNYYYNILKDLNFNSLIDIGCGSGDFLINIDSKFTLESLVGVDKSCSMVNIAKSKGLRVFNSNLKDIDESFDVATATFDMINYLTPQEFIAFFEDLKSVVKSGGYFIFDANSEFGLSDLAVGNFIAQDNDRYLTIESFYEAGVYDSIFTLFEKNKDCYKRYSQSISQYYYSEEFFNLLSGWELVSGLPIKLYEMENCDKIIYVLKNVT